MGQLIIPLYGIKDIGNIIFQPTGIAMVPVHVMGFVGC